MTTRLDHTTCSHDRTPAARGRCRKLRLAQIKACQQEYMKIADMTGATDDEVFAIREYEAGIDIFAVNWGMDLADAYALIERGPVVH